MAFESADLGLEAVRLTASVGYAAVAVLVLRRTVGQDARPAQRGFALWWLGIAAAGVASVPTGLGWDPAGQGVGPWRAWIYLEFGVVLAALAGLVYYLLYLYTGRRALWRPVGLFYVLVAGLLVYLVEGFGPHSAPDGEGGTTILFARPHPEGLVPFFSLLLSLPPLASATAYFGLLFRLPDREARYRILLVSLGLGAWFAYSVLGTVFGFVADVAESRAGLVAGQVFGLLAALMVLMAFAPPQPLRRWLRQEAPA